MSYLYGTMSRCALAFFVTLIVSSLSVETLAQPDSNADETTTASNKTLPAGAIVRMGKADEANRALGVYRVLFSTDEKKLVTRGADQIIRVWNLDDGRQLFALDGHEDRVMGLSFSPDGTQLVSVSPGADEKIQFWNMTDGTKSRQLEGSGSVIRFLADGKSLVVVASNHYQKFRLKDGTRQGEVMFASNRRALTLSPDGQLIAEYSDANARKTSRHNLVIRDVNEWEKKAVLTGLEDIPASVAFSPDGKWLAASARRLNTFHLWNISGKTKPLIMDAHSEQIQALVFSADGRQLASASWDKTVRIWEVFTGKQIAVFEGHAEHVCCVQFSPSGRLLASGAAGRTENGALVWDVHAKLLPAGEPPSSLDPAYVEKAWNQLSNADPQVAYRTVGLMRANPDLASRVYKSFLTPAVEPNDTASIAKLIADLDNEEFYARENATKKLIKLRAVAEVLLMKALKKTKSPEVRYRIRLILETPVPKSKLTETQRRQFHRYIYVLELIGGKESHQRLQQLSTGYPDPTVIREAAAALQRLDGVESRGTRVEGRGTSAEPLGRSRNLLRSKNGSVE